MRYRETEEAAHEVLDKWGAPREETCQLCQRTIHTQRLTLAKRILWLSANETLPTQ